MHARTSLLNFGTLVRKVPQFFSRQLVHHAREQIFRGRVQDTQTCRAKASWSECVVPQVLHHASSIARPAILLECFACLYLRACCLIDCTLHRCAFSVATCAFSAATCVFSAATRAFFVATCTFSAATLLTHHVVYHVDFHGATSHMENHVVNHGRKTTW